MKLLSFVFCLLSTTVAFSQKDSLKISDKYLEDQLYISVTYNVLSNQPSTVNESGFSYGFSGGFIKDIPLNEKRNFGFGLGLGYGFDSFNHGLKISENNNQTTFEVDNNVTSNKMRLHTIELPIELRWRNSTKNKYAFWRIYSGIKLTYNFYNKFEYTTATNTVAFNNIAAFNKLQTGFIISAGYAAFNIHFYYGFSPLFKEASFNGNAIDTKIMKFGLTFYIL